MHLLLLVIGFYSFCELCEAKLVLNFTDQLVAGTTIYNASLPESGFKYSLSLASQNASYFVNIGIRINSDNGILYLSKPLKCVKLSRNPISFSIFAVRRNHFTCNEKVITPVSVYVHGQDCFVKHRRKSDELSSLNTISACVDLVSCYSRGQFVMKINRYLLPSLSCNTLLYSENSETKSAVNFHNDTWEIHLTAEQCLHLAELQGALFLSFQCLRGSKSFQLLLKLSSFETISNKKLEDNYDSAKSRSRRAVNVPRFQQQRYVRKVLEEQEPPLLIDTITAFDINGNNRLTYSLLATKDLRSQQMFSIDPISGEITTTQKLDRELIATHFLSVIATIDSSRPVKSASTQLVITVLDVNDHMPQFEKSTYSTSVSEYVGIGESVITVRATDDDTDDNGVVEYNFALDSNTEGIFSINSRTGSITTLRVLDREKQDFYRLLVTASDKALIAERQTSTATVEMYILDENDNRPYFDKSLYSIEVNEDIDYSNKPTIAEVAAFDLDIGLNGVIRYSISSGNELGTFAIDSESGQVMLVKSLDYEKYSSFQLTIRAQDSGNPPKSNTTVVNIKVLDINDNDPCFLLPLYQALITENIPKGTNVLKLQAYDSDSGLNGALLYTIINNQNYLPFTIGQSTGQLVTNGTIDREQKSRYFFKVEARDQGEVSRSVIVPVEINVRDVNDNAPVFAQAAYDATISEESALGSSVAIVSATDNDEAENGQFSYSIHSGNTLNAFNIHKQNGLGLITVARKLNYREQNTFALVIAATDHGGLNGYASVFVNITAANIHSPVFQGTPYFVRISEDLPVGGTVFRVSATDDDIGNNADIFYSITDNNESFLINAATGVIVTKQSLDRESVSSYVLTLVARDKGLPSKSDTAELVIVLNDVNDNPPVFLQPYYSGKISEDALVGTSVAAIFAIDVDQDQNGRVWYTFDNGNDGGGDFTIDGVQGTIRVARMLDREKTARYELVAFAVDKGDPELSTSVIITVDIDDVNDNAPQFDMGVLHLYVKENSPIGTCIGQISAVDPDSSDYAYIEYTLLEGFDWESFSMVASPNESATIYSEIELDYEGGRKEYVISVRARSFDLFSDVIVRIHVQDINDNVPTMKDFKIIFNNFENHFPTGFIGRIPAVDLDVNDTLRFKFLTGNQANILHLNETLGLLRLDSRLNSDVPTNATLLVSVSGELKVYI